MGTLSKRPLRDFGVDVRHDLRSGISNRERARKTADTLSLPASAPWLALAGASFVGALALKVSGRNHWAVLVGQWAPAFLLLGLYVERSAKRPR